MRCFATNPHQSDAKTTGFLLLLFDKFLPALENPFLLRASSASIQLAATEPDARTNCRTSSALLIVLGSCFTNTRTNSANRNVRSSRSRGLVLSSISELGFHALLGFW